VTRKWRERLQPFLAAARDRSATGRGLPAHLERDLCAYLDCGILARGFARAAPQGAKAGRITRRRWQRLGPKADIPAWARSGHLHLGLTLEVLPAVLDSGDREKTPPAQPVRYAADAGSSGARRRSRPPS